MSRYRGQHRKIHGLSRGLIFVFLTIVLLLILSIVVMFLWNAILPDLIDVKKITFVQSIGLLILCRILFGSFGWNRRHKNHLKKMSYWKEKWMNMSDEERSQLRNKWKHNCGSNINKSDSTNP